MFKFLLDYEDTKLLINSCIKKDNIHFYTFTFNGAGEEFPKILIDDIEECLSKFVVTNNCFYWGETGDNSKIINHYHAICKHDKFRQYSNIRRKLASQKKSPYKKTPPNKLNLKKLIVVFLVEDTFNLLYLLGYYFHKENKHKSKNQFTVYKKMYNINYEKNRLFREFVDNKNLVKSNKKIMSKPDKKGTITCISKTHFAYQFIKYAKEYKLNIDKPDDFAKLLVTLQKNHIAVLHYKSRDLIHMYNVTKAILSEKNQLNYINKLTILFQDYEEDIDGQIHQTQKAYKKDRNIL